MNKAALKAACEACLAEVNKLPDNATHEHLAKAGAGVGGFNLQNFLSNAGVILQALITVLPNLKVGG